MSDRTFRLILDGKKGQLVKGSTPLSAAKKVGFYTNSVKTGKSSIKFELQETTKGSKKKVYGPYKTKVKMAGGVNPFSLPSNNKNPPKNTSLPPFDVNNSNELPNHINLNPNFSGFSKSDLAKQLSTLIKIKQRIQKLHDEFSRALSNKKRSIINSLDELPKNTKPLSNITTLPSLKNIKPNKTYKSNINLANYNLQDSLVKEDVQEKFWELHHFFKKISDLIRKIEAKLYPNHLPSNHHEQLSNISEQPRNNPIMNTNIPKNIQLQSNYIVNNRGRFPTKPPNTQHGLPTAQSVLKGIKNLRTTEEREYQQYNKQQKQKRNAAREQKYTLEN
jgi:hypothetical protein